MSVYDLNFLNGLNYMWCCVVLSSLVLGRVVLCYAVLCMCV